MNTSGVFADLNPHHVHLGCHGAGVTDDTTRARDALNADRRRLPMVEITKDRVFHTYP